MFAIASGILIAAMLLGALYVGWSLLSVDAPVGWAVMGFTVVVALVVIL